MSTDWVAERVASIGGRFRIVMTKPGWSPRDVTWFRGVPVKIGSFSSTDPFGDSTAVLEFPQVSAYDDLQSPDVGSWLADDAAVDIWYIPAMARPEDWPEDSDVDDMAAYMNPLSGQPDLIAPAWVYELDGSDWVRTGVRRGGKVYEGHVSSIENSNDESGGKVSAQCQGALFQGDCYLSKPFFPPRPQTVESLILGVFDKNRRPHLRTSRPVIDWPAGWTRVAPSFAGTSNVFTPNVKPGAKWTGYTTRQTGSWDHSLTGFIQSLLATMLVKRGSGVPPGNQWTLRLARQGDPSHPAGRTPVLTVRDVNREPDFEVWVGTPGVTHSMTRDSTQKADVIYGSGTDVAGTEWRGAVVSSNGNRTDYLPMAFTRDVYPATENKHLNTAKMMRESYVQFGTGFDQLDATDSAEQMLQRDRDPGWSGTITLRTDPSEDISRWEIIAGWTVRLKGFAGSGEVGKRFHIAQVEANPEEGSVSLTVDTRYRDALTLHEAIARTRDALTPAKLLQLNRNSVTIEDVQAPWDYSAGSGFIPKPSRIMHKHRPVSDRFPYKDWVKDHPPKDHGEWYVTCKANAPKSKDRWAAAIPVLMSEKGTIRRSEFYCVDRNGNILAIPFHVSLYYNNGIDASFMPTDGHVYSPFITGAFQSINPATGQPWNTPGHEADESMAIGWGNKEQPAGYSPGRKTAGTKATGLLVDESSWTFDCSARNPNYDHLAKAGKKQLPGVISLYAMFYAEYKTTVYFQGRLFRQEPGTQ